MWSEQTRQRVEHLPAVDAESMEKIEKMLSYRIALRRGRRIDHDEPIGG